MLADGAEATRLQVLIVLVFILLMFSGYNIIQYAQSLGIQFEVLSSFPSRIC